MRTKIQPIWFVLLGFSISFSQTSTTERLRAWEHHQRLRDESIFKNMKWQTLGPSFIGGRIESIACPPGNNFTIYVGAGAGNAWKTVNNGLTWQPIFENESTFTIGAIAVANSKPNIVWIGSGEVLMARSSFAGTGVFKSTDAGKTWQNMGLHDTQHIGRVLIDPVNPEIVYVAAIGHNYSQNEERGLFKTSNGGETWQRILYVSDRVGVSEVVMDPVDNQILYAVTWERDRKAWNNVEGGEGSGVHKSIDAGLTWKRLTGGLPTGKYVGRTGLAIAPSNPNVIYALLDNETPRSREKEDTENILTIARLQKLSRKEFLALDAKILEKSLRKYGFSRKQTAETILEMVSNDEISLSSLVRHFVNLRERQQSRTRVIGGEVYRSNNKGETWTKVNEEDLATRVGYDMTLIKVSPDNENEVYVLGSYLLASRDGAKTFRRVGGDIVHFLAHKSTVLHLDHHEMWIDPVNPDRIILGTDGGLYVSYDRGESWLHINNIPIGEFYDVSVDDANPYNIYGGTQDNAAVYGPLTSEPKPVEGDGWKTIYLDRWGGGDSYSTVVDPTDLNTIYYEHQFGRLYRKNMLDGSQKNIMPEAEIGEPFLRYNWMAPFIISHYNPFTLYFGANKLFKSVDRGDTWESISPDLSTHPGPEKQGDVPFGTLTTISESTLRKGHLYVGTDDGNIQVTKDDGVSWNLVNVGLPQKWVSRVVASQYQPGVVYVSLTGYREDDFSAYLFRSENFGERWTSISMSLPHEPINVVAEDPGNRNILYVGTDLGIYISLNQGESWSSLRANLPTTPVHDLVVHPREHDLIIGTHGRGIFVLDVGVIQQLDEVTLAEEAYLFEIESAKLASRRSGRGVWEQEANLNAIITFYLKASAKAVVRIANEDGGTVRRFQGTYERGLNVVEWDLTRETAEGKANSGTNYVEPGNYSVEIRTSGLKLRGQVRVNKSFK